MPLLGPLGGEQTFIESRWYVSANSSGVLTLTDPAGGVGPVGFDDQFNTNYSVYREKTAQLYDITDCANPGSVTIVSDPGIAVGEYVQLRYGSTALDPIPVGVIGPVSSLARGYTLPFLATGKASNVLTVASYLSGPAQPSADDQYN